MTPHEQETIARILREARTIAVVGISDDPARAGYFVPAYLQAHGYRIIPVNPNLAEVLGERAYASLKDVTEPIDVVQLFRRSEDVEPFVEEAIAVGAKVVWMQLGIANEQAAAKASAAGLDVVMNQCMKVQHTRLHSDPI